MSEFYTEQDKDRWKKRFRFSQSIIIALLFSALAFCVYFCFHVHTGNVGKMYFSTVFISVLSGWAAILITVLLLKPSAAEYRHCKNILSSGRETYQGYIHLLNEPFSIPKGIRISRILLKSGDGENKSFSVNTRFIGKLPADGTHVQLSAAGKFVTSCRVIP